MWGRRGAVCAEEVCPREAAVLGRPVRRSGGRRAGEAGVLGRLLGLVCLSAGPGKGSRGRCAVRLSGALTHGSGVALKRKERLTCWVTGGKEGGGGGLGRSGVREEVGRFARGFGFWFWVSGFLSYLLFSFLFSILILKQTHMLEFKSEFEFKPQSLN